jgi:hypothetical protein
MTTLLHGLLSLRDRPDFEKQGWKALFDYYLFGPADRPARTARARARPLGPMDEMKARRLRACCSIASTAKNEGGRHEGQIVKKVVIAGGGTAGWMAAAALSRNWGRCSRSPWSSPTRSARSGSGNRPSPRPAPSTPCSIIDEREFMRATQATFKLGHLVRELGRDRRPLHPLVRPGRQIHLDGRASITSGCRRGRKGSAASLGDYCFELKAAEQTGSMPARTPDELRLPPGRHALRPLPAPHERGLGVGGSRARSPASAALRDGFIEALVWRTATR